MTSETRTTIQLADIVAIEFECHNCHSKVIRPISLDNAVPARCSQGCQPQWFIDTSQDHLKMRELLALMEYCSKINSKDFSFRLEVRGLGNLG